MMEDSISAQNSNVERLRTKKVWHVQGNSKKIISAGL